WSVSRAPSFWFSSQGLVQGITTLDGSFPIRQPGRTKHGLCSCCWSTFVSTVYESAACARTGRSCAGEPEPSRSRDSHGNNRILGYRPWDRGPFPLPPFVHTLPRLRVRTTPTGSVRPWGR